MGEGGWSSAFIDDIRKHREYSFTTFVINCSFFLSSFGDRLWTFAIGLFIHQLGGITWVAIQQLCDSIAKLVLTPILGQKLDKMNRLTGIQAVLFVNNVSITISAAIYYLSFAYESHSTLLIVFAVIFGSISRVASGAQQIALTKDWIVVMVKSYDGARLSSQNTLLNSMVQLAAFFTPIVTGAMMTAFSNMICCVFIVCLNIALWVVEASVLLWIYKKRLPALSTKKEGKKTTAVKSNAQFAVYFRQRCAKAAVGLSLLYMTILGFDNLALSYGASQGMSPQMLGNFRAFGSALGFAGSLAYAAIERCTGVLTTGLIGLVLQNLFVCCCFISVFLPGSPFAPVHYFSNLTLQSWWGTIVHNVIGTTTAVNSSVPMSETTDAALLATTASSEAVAYTLSLSMLVFFCGISLARFGLWVADPAITQIMQEEIPENERYTVFGVQTSLCSFFSMSKDVLIILFSATEIFGGLTILSYMFATAGLILYILHFCQEYGHKTETVDSEKKPEQNFLLVSANDIEEKTEEKLEIID